MSDYLKRNTTNNFIKNIFQIWLRYENIVEKYLIKLSVDANYR